MPVHDWTRVDAGTFHHFHLAWIGEICKALNNGILSDDFYAMAEQVTGGIAPDVLTLQSRRHMPRVVPTRGNGAATVIQAPPRARFTLKAEEAEYLLKQRRLVVRHKRGDRIVALLEIVSPGNKSSRNAITSFSDKAISALHQGLHLSIVDLFPPTRRDPAGIHGAIWSELGERGFKQPASKPLTLVAYSAERPITAYVEPFAVGDPLPDLPLFLAGDAHVLTPLEATYQEAWSGMPRRWRSVLEK